LYPFLGLRFSISRLCSLFLEKGDFVKRLLWFVFATAVLVSSFKLVFGQEIAYTYKVVNQTGTLQDINKHGDTIAWQGTHR
jgi:hypothetical protein